MRAFAYLGEDGQVRVHDLDSDLEQIVSRSDGEADDSAGCACPTWSPDGNQLAYLRYELAQGELHASALHLVSPDGSQNRVLHRFEGSVPIYVNWSPDGSRLALLLQTGRQLALHIADAVGNAPPWSPPKEHHSISPGIRPRHCSSRTREDPARCRGADWRGCVSTKTPSNPSKFQ